MSYASQKDICLEMAAFWQKQKHRYLKDQDMKEAEKCIYRSDRWKRRAYLQGYFDAICAPMKEPTHDN